ncbi:MAG: hypothetical protein HY069_02765 [Chlamydiia bacterium]|nr:hypothetical protein [Chlamydiia bacterium]
MKKIFLWVFGIHIALLLLLTGDYFIRRKHPIQQRIVVRSVALPSPRKPPPQKPAPAIAASKKEKPVSASPQTTTKTAKSAPSSSKKPPVLQAEEPGLLQQIVKNLDSLSAISKQPPKKREELAIPQLLPVTAEIAPEQTIEPTAAEFMIAFLQSELQLPEYGDVTAKIAIDPAGRLISCEILSAQRKKNGDFLKKRLPELYFPWFNRGATFTITFRNEENTF